MPRCAKPCMPRQVTRPTERTALRQWLEVQQKRCAELFRGGTPRGRGTRCARVEPVPAQVDGEEQVDGRIVLRDNFKALFERHPELLTFGEDTGKIGGVNQAMEGMQESVWPDRVSDTGIRECTIIGQGIGPRHAWIAADRRNPVPRLPLLRPAVAAGRSGYGALPQRRHPACTAHCSDAGPSPRGRMARREPDGGHHSQHVAACTFACRAT